jgi:hypothetical protein
MIKNILALIFIGCIIAGCKETPPDISFKTLNTGNIIIDNDTSYVNDTPSAAVAKAALIEDFTGTSCPNCPSAHEAITDIITIHGAAKVVAVSIHPKSEALKLLTAPHGEDLRNADGAIVLSLLGGSNALPTGNVNRKYNVATSNHLFGYSNWSNLTTQALANSTQIVLGITPKFDIATNLLKIKVKTECTDTVHEAISLTVYLIENNVITGQEYQDQNGDTKTDDQYIHNHLLREVLTPGIGRQLVLPSSATIYEKGRVYENNFSVPFTGKNWNPSNCKVIAFVHRSAGGNKEVLQVMEVSIK